jgi:molybdopterin/thiamine biosynthesis adenylyltransferase
MPTATAKALARHLTRDDLQEDICFVLWRPSTGESRASALIHTVVWPDDGERHVHGNASFESRYLLRAAELAADIESGIGLIHSHPGGTGWQNLSTDDTTAEATNALAASKLTGLPMLGLTYATRDKTFSARFWRTNPAEPPLWCESVRVVGDRMRVSFNPKLRPTPPTTAAQVRTVSAWGDDIQCDLARLRVGVIGAGSVAGLVAEGLARVGITNVTLIDFDSVETVNLDRLCYATPTDVTLARSKVDALARYLRQAATAVDFMVDPREDSVVERRGFERALDMDVLFSCVDRPWPRALLNVIAYAHLIPVVDGGLTLYPSPSRMRGAEWRAHVAAPGRRCLKCLGQYDPAHVSLERTGLLDDPSYIDKLPPDHVLRARQNVFPFSAATSSAELIEFLRMIVAPAGLADVGASLFHFATGKVDLELAGCDDDCRFSGTLIAQGDMLDLYVADRHELAETHRQAQHKAAARPTVRLRRATARLSDWLTRLAT